MAEAEVKPRANGRSKELFGAQSTQGDMLMSMLAWALSAQRNGGSPYPDAPAWSTYVARWMMEDPVVALSFGVTIYPVLSSTWSVDADEDASDEQVNYGQGEYVEQRIFLLKQLAYSLQFGARLLARRIEVVDGYQCPRWQPLRPEITEFIVDTDTGAFLGARQDQKEAKAEDLLRHTNDLEDDNWLGRARLLNFMREAWWPSQCLAKNIQKIENNKLVGVMPVWYYDTSPRRDPVTREIVDPKAEAEEGLLKLHDAVGLAIPNMVTDNMTMAEINEASKTSRNRIDIVQFPDAAGAMTALMDRARNYDSNKMRGMLKPERMALEGVFGTKAEAGEHADVGLADSHFLHVDWTKSVDDAFQVDLARNFPGYKRGSVTLKAGPLSDGDKAFYRTLVTTLLTNPAVADLMVMAIDKDSVLDRADIPKSDETIDFDKLQAELEEKRANAAPDPNAVPPTQEDKDNLDKFAAALSARRKYTFNCGTGGGGFQPGNTCAKGGGGDTEAKYRDPATGKWDGTRAREVHEPMLAKIREGVPKSDAPTLYMTGGGYGSGKSTVIEHTFPTAREAVHVDPDGMKKGIPEFHELSALGDANAASAVHEESSYIAKRGVTENLIDGRDVMYDSSGNTGITKLEAKVEGFRANGATRVVANYAFPGSIEEAVARADSRAEGQRERGETPRFVPHALLRENHHDVSSTWQAAAKRGTFDELNLYSTAGKFGTPPELIASARGGKVEVHDRDMFSRFVELGGGDPAGFSLAFQGNGCNQYGCPNGAGGAPDALALNVPSTSKVSYVNPSFVLEKDEMLVAHVTASKNAESIQETGLSVGTGESSGPGSAGDTNVWLWKDPQSVLENVKSPRQAVVVFAIKKADLKDAGSSGYVVKGVDKEKIAFIAKTPNKKISLAFDCGTGVGGFKSGNACAKGDGAGYASKREQLQSAKLANDKVQNAPVPTREAVAKARLELKRAAAGEGRSGGENRGGGSKDRARQRENLYKEFGGAERGYVVCPWTGQKMHWSRDPAANPRGYPTFERGKIFTKSQGGGYQLGNLLPESFAANRSRGDAPLRTRKGARSAA